MPDGQNNHGHDQLRRSTTEDDITAAVLARFAATPDPRLKQIMLALIKMGYSAGRCFVLEGKCCP